MAVTPTKLALDAHKLRADFPIFEQHFHGKPLAYLDSAVAAQKPRQVLRGDGRVLRDVVHERPPRRLRAVRARHRRLRGRPREGARVRERVLHARDHLPAECDRGDQPRRVLVGAEQPRPRRPRHRHRARAPLQLRPLAVHGHAGWAPTSACSRSTTTARCGLDALDETAAGGTRQGRRLQPRLQLAGNDQRRRDARRVGARAGRRSTSVDAAQAAPHRRIDVQELGCDFLAVSGHKMCGPSGIGFLWGRAELLERMEPFLMGGHMIRKVAYEQTTWGELPHKFEAGSAPSRGGRRPRRGDRLPRGGRPRRDRGLRARARRVRAGAARGGARHRPVRPARRPPRRHRLVQRRRVPPARRRADPRHGRASRSAPATTAASR